MQKSNFIRSACIIFVLVFAFFTNASADTLSDAQQAAISDHAVLNVAQFNENTDHMCFVSSTGAMVLDGSVVMPSYSFKNCIVLQNVNTDGSIHGCGTLSDGTQYRCDDGTTITGDVTPRQGFREYQGITLPDGVSSEYSYMTFGMSIGTGIRSSVVMLAGLPYHPIYDGCYVKTDGSAQCRSDYNTVLYDGGTDAVDAGVMPSKNGGANDLYAVVHLDGSVSTNVPSGFTEGPYATVVGRNWYGYTSAYGYGFCMKRTNGVLDCKNSSVSWITDNAPTFPVRNASCGGNVCYAVKSSDNTIWQWNASGLSQYLIAGNPQTAGGPAPPVETVTSEGLNCVTTSVPNIEDVTWMTPGFFSLTGSFTRTDTAGGSQYACNDHITYSTCGDKITVYNKTDDGLSLDRLNAYNYSPGETLIFSGSWRYPGTGNRSVLVRDPDYSRYMVALGSIRDGANVKSDVFQFFSVANPSSVIPWAGVWNSVTKKWESVRAGTGGVATVAYPAGVTDIILQVRDLSVPPIGFRRGTANSYVAKTDCSKDSNQCNSFLVGTGMVCAGATVNGYVGDCAFDTAGRCAPVKRDDGSYTNGTPEEGANVIHDSQGNVVGVIPGGSAINPGTGRANGDAIFACDEDEGYISCVLHVLRNGWNAINDTFSSADSVKNSISKTTQHVGSGSTGSLYTGTFSTGAEQDLGNRVFNGGWNVIAGDAGNDPFKLLAQRIWTTVLFVLFFFVILLLIVVIRSRKNSNPDA